MVIDHDNGGQPVRHDNSILSDTSVPSSGADLIEARPP
jgi:hypothetical protein